MFSLVIPNDCDHTSAISSKVTLREIKATMVDWGDYLETKIVLEQLLLLKLHPLLPFEQRF